MPLWHPSELPYRAAFQEPCGKESVSKGGRMTKSTLAIIAFVVVSGCGSEQGIGQTEATSESLDKVVSTTEAIVTTTAETTTTTTTTLPPTTAPTLPPTTLPPPTLPPTTAVVTTAAASGGCHPSYSGCVPMASDVDCAGGSGNGPAYASGPIQVIGPDVFDLDRDGDGVACE